MHLVPFKVLCGPSTSPPSLEYAEGSRRSVCRELWRKRGCRLFSPCAWLCSPPQEPLLLPGPVSVKEQARSLLLQQGQGRGFGKDSHGSAFHQGLNELQEVSGDDREGVLHEQLQVSDNLHEMGHSRSKGNGADLVTKYCSAQSLGRVIPPCAMRWEGTSLSCHPWSLISESCYILLFRGHSFQGTSQLLSASDQFGVSRSS